MRDPGTKQGRRRDVVPLLVWFAASLASGCITSCIGQNAVGAQGSEYDLTLGDLSVDADSIVPRKWGPC